MADGEAAHGREPPPPDLNTGCICRAAGRLLLPASPPEDKPFIRDGAVILLQFPEKRLAPRVSTSGSGSGTRTRPRVAHSAVTGGPKGRCPLLMSRGCHPSGLRSRRQAGRCSLDPPRLALLLPGHDGCHRCPRLTQHRGHPAQGDAAREGHCPAEPLPGA